MQWLQPSGLSITSSLRQWRKKDAQQQPPPPPPPQQQQSSQPQPLTSTTDQTLPQIPPISENGSHVARVAPQAHYSRPSTDVYRFPPQYPDYGLSFKDINSPGKYSEIVDNGPPHLPQDPKEKEYLKMCSIQQQHLKQYPDPTLKPPYPGASMKHSYDTGLHPQMHPYMQKESPLPPYMQKEMQYTPQCFQKFNMQPPPQYGNNYVPESNSFLATLSKINPRMAQSIIGDPHIREASMGYSNVDQNHNYAHPQRLYQSQPPMHTSPGYQGGHRNLASAPQGYSCAQQYGYKPPPDSYNRLPQYQAPNSLGQANHELSTRQPYRDNIPLPMNYSAVSQKMSPSYSQCAAQLEYSQHYQHRRYQMSPEFYQQNYKSPYIQNQDLPSVPETAVPSARMKQFWESWGEDEVEAIPEAAGSEQEKRKEDRPAEQLYVLGATEIPRDSLGQYVDIEALPENMRELYENGSIIIKATTTENSVQDMEVVASSSNRINILDHKRILPGATAAATAAATEQVVNLHILEAPKQQDEASTQAEWFAEEKGSPKSMPTISDLFEEAVAPEQIAETESQSEVFKASMEDASTDRDDEAEEEEEDVPEVAETTKDSITNSLKTEVEDKTNIPGEEAASGRGKVVEGCSVIVNRRKTIEEIVQKITFKKNCEDLSSGCSAVEEKFAEQVILEEKKEEPAEEATTVLEDPEVEDSSSDVQLDKTSDEERSVTPIDNAEADGEETFETEALDDLKDLSDENFTTMEESPESVNDSLEPLKINAFKLENNNVLLNLDGALLEIKINYEGRKKIITVVPYSGDSDSDAEEEAHLLDALESSRELEKDKEVQQVEEVAAAVEVQTEGVEEQSGDFETEQEVEEVESAKEEVETAKEELLEMEAELHEVSEVEELAVEVETAKEESLEMEAQLQEGSEVDESVDEKAECNEEQVLEDEATKAIESDFQDDTFTEVEIQETKYRDDEAVNEDTPELEGDFEDTGVDRSLREIEVADGDTPELGDDFQEIGVDRSLHEVEIEDTPELEDDFQEIGVHHEVEVEEQLPEEVFFETEVAANNEVPQETVEETKRREDEAVKEVTPELDGAVKEIEVEEQPTEEVFLETAKDEADKVIPQESPIIEEQSALQMKIDDDAIFEANVSGEVIISSVDKIEIEEAIADSTETEAGLQKPSMLTKASRKHFSDDDMVVKSETQAKLATKRRRELRERRVTIAEELPRVAKEDEGPPVKKVRFSSGKTRVPMINSLYSDGSMREQVEEATFQEKSSRKRKLKLEEKSYFAIDLTKNRDGGTKSSKHHHNRPVRLTVTKDLPECEVTTTTRTVEDKIEVPTLNDFQARTDEGEVTSSTKVVVNVKSYVSRSISEDSSDGGQKKRLTLEEYTNRKKRLNSSASPATEVPLESQEILNQFTKKVLEPKIIDINEFDIPTRSQELNEIRKSPSYTIENSEAVKTFQQEIDFKLKSLDFQLIKQKEKEKNDSLMRRFLNNEKLTEAEMQKVKEIIHCKRMLVEMNKLRMQKLATEHKYERLEANSNMKLHLKKIVETKPRKRFRNLYAESSSDSDGTATAQISRDPRINRRLHGDAVESDYLAYQTKVKNGVPKIIIRRRLLPTVMQPYVKLERSPQIDLLAKRRRVC